MNPRRSIYLSSFAHQNPIPAASVVGQMLFSGAITGRDPRTHEMPATMAAQCANIFFYIRAIMEEAGGSIDTIGKITFHLGEYRDRAALNIEWLKMFPDEATRPARQVLAAELDGGALIHADMVAVLEG